jgi:hypothetical protein
MESTPSAHTTFTWERGALGGVPCVGAPDAQAPGSAEEPFSTTSVMQSLADSGCDQRFLGGLSEKLQDYHRAQEKLYGMLAVEQQRVQELLRDNTRLQQLLNDRTRMEELLRANTLLHERLCAATSRCDSGTAAGGSYMPAQGQPPPAPMTPPRSKRPSAASAPRDEAALDKRQKRPSLSDAELTHAEVMEMVQNVKPLFGLHQWSFVDTDVQNEFWQSLWQAPAFNKNCKARKADPEGSAWMILRGLGYGNVGRHDCYYNADHLGFYWSLFACVQNAYKNSKVVLGTKAKVPSIVKDMLDKQRSRPAEKPASPMRLMSQMSDRHKAILESHFESFDVERFLVSIFPFLPESEARWQPGRRKQLFDFAKSFRDFIERDKIMFSAPGSELA